MPANFAAQLPPTTHHQLTALASKYGVGKSTVVQRLLTAYLAGGLKVEGLPTLKPGELGTGAYAPKTRRRGLGERP